MSVFKLDKLIGEGARGYNRRVGNTVKPISGGSNSASKPTSSGGSAANTAAMIARSPEAVVKISSFGKGKGVKANLDYISRDGKLDLEKPDGSKVSGKEEVAKHAQEWANKERRRSVKQRDTVNIVLSMPPGTSPEKVLTASRAFAAKEFGEKRDYVFVQHKDEAHPHVHMAVRMAGYDGSRLNPRKEDLQRWREVFAEQLRDQGVDAAATVRPARGITKKAERQPIIHIRKKGKQPEVDTQRVKDAIDHIAKGKPQLPWEKAIADRQTELRKSYTEAVQTLAAGQDPDDKKTAAKLAAFLNDLPAPTTRRTELVSTMTAHIDGLRDKSPTLSPESQAREDLDR